MPDEMRAFIKNRVSMESITVPAIIYVTLSGTTTRKLNNY